MNVASSNGLMGTAYTGPYSATKAALINLTKTLAIEFAEEPIRVNAVCPRPMATEIAAGVMPDATIKHDKIARYSGLRGMGDAGDVARVVAFLASDAAAGVHGAIWTAEAGCKVIILEGEGGGLYAAGVEWPPRGHCPAEGGSVYINAMENRRAVR